MALITDYTDLSTLRGYRRINAPGDTADDTVMSRAITAASRSIDIYCDRPFGQDAAPTVRTYTWAGSYLNMQSAPYVQYVGSISTMKVASLELDDVSTATGLVVKTDTDMDGVYETTLTLNSDFRLWPLNAIADGEPYTHLILTPTSNKVLPWQLAGVQVTATFGWPAIPAEVTQACLLQANRLCGRRDSWAGVAGSPELGNELRLLSKLDADLGPLLAGRRRLWVAA